MNRSPQSAWRRSLRGALGLIGILGPLLLAGSSRAEEEYVLGPEDVISITVWEHPELSRTVAVRANGKLTLPPLGDLTAAGKTTSMLARDLERELYNALRQTTQVTVTVVAFNSNRIYLAGQVASPGRYTFEAIPPLIDVLGQAGGLGGGADLSGVRILRRQGAQQQTLQVDLARAMQQGDVSGLPALQTGDVVFVPPAALTGTTSGVASLYLLGEVIRPGPYSAGSQLDLAQAIALAGGATPAADLSRVEVLASDGMSGSYLLRVNLEEELKAGRPGPKLRPGDTVVIPRHKAGAGLTAWGVFRETIGVSRDVLNLLLIRNVLDDNQTNN